VLNANDGSVVALASNPSFPVQEFTNGLPAARFKELNDPKNHFPLLNRAVQGLYAPGSTFKLITSIAALQENITNPEEVIADRGFVIFGSEGQERTFQNAGKTPHGTVRLVRGITLSSDVYFYIMGFRFFDEWNKGHEAKGFAVQRVARQLGFGKPTGIGLANEARGRIPDDKFKKAFNKNNPDKFAQQWLPGDSANLAVGQGDMLVTPLQLANAYAAFINGGKIFQPHLADKVLTPGHQQTLRELPTRLVSRITIKPEVRDPIMEGLLGVTHSVEGTAQPAFSDYQGVDVGGKTGTAEQQPKQDNALFVGVVNPNPTPEQKCEKKPGGDRSGCQYVVVVVVEQGGFGGSVAAPIARRIIDGLNGNPDPDPVRLRPRKTD
jgi:penicillin-binding protein 2